MRWKGAQQHRRCSTSSQGRGSRTNKHTRTHPHTHTHTWSAGNGGVTNGGLRGVWPPVLVEIGLFHPFLCLFAPPPPPKSTWKIQKTEEKGLFPQISSVLLKPPSLKPLFVDKADVLQRFSYGARELKWTSGCPDSGWAIPEHSWKHPQNILRTNSEFLGFEVWEKLTGGFPYRELSHFFRERSRLCRGPFWNCSS